MILRKHAFLSSPGLKQGEVGKGRLFVYVNISTFSQVSG